MKFTVLNRNTGQKKSLDLAKETITIGRTDQSDLVLNSKLVSRNHAEITRIGDDWFITDLKSGNGTFLNGKKLKANEKTPLISSDSIRIEEFEIEGSFEPPAAAIDLNRDPQEENTDSGIIEIKMIKKVLSAIEPDKYPSLEVLDDIDAGKRVYFTDDLQEIVIGRDSDCGLSINSNTVSRRHAVLQKKWGGANIRDLQSKNGTKVNGQAITEKLLKDGDTVLVGEIRLLFRNPQEVDLEAISRQYQEPEAPPQTDQEPSLEEATPPSELVSEGAKASVDSEDEPKEEAKKDDPLEFLVDENTPAQIDDDTPVEAPEPPKESPIALQLKALLTRFSPIELACMAGGAVILVAAFIAILVILF